MALRPFRSLTTVSVAALLLSAAACSDPVTDPASALRPDTPRFTTATGPTTTVVVDPTVTNVYQSVEGHRLVIPAGSICTPGSTYGPAYWNSACTPATQPITFTITTYTTSTGRAGLTVKPDVRFVPTKTVMGYLKDPIAANRSNAIIEYCTPTGCRDEGITDAAMTTYRDPAAGYVYRRLKHFSGYNVVFGRSCENPDPNTGECPPDGSTSKSPLSPVQPSLFSGYITTTARDDR